MKSLLGIALFCAAIAVACATPAPAPGKVITVKANGTTVNLDQNTPFTVVLNGIPSAGYNWLFDSLQGDSVIENGKPTFKPGSGIGSQGTYLFPFSTTSSGLALLKLVYARSWEGQPHSTFTCTFNVN